MSRICRPGVVALDGRTVRIPRTAAAPAARAVRPRGAARRRASTGVLCRAAAAGGSEAGGIGAFIRNVCPEKGFDGSYRERLPTEASIEAVLLDLLSIGVDGCLTPGCRQVVTLSESAANAVVADDGRIILAQVEQGPSGPAVPAPRKGSRAVLAQLVGIQRVGDMAYLQIVVEERVIVQGVRVAEDGSARARAEPLHDRWVFFTRAEAVSELSVQAQDGENQHAGQPQESAGTASPETATALRDATVAAHDLRGVITSVADLCRRSGDADLEAAADEWAYVLAWCGSAAGLPAMERVSYAAHAYAAELTRDALNMPPGELASLRSAALDATDLGMRLEDALEALRVVQRELGARVSLMGLGGESSEED
ncbi:unnamed protein product [Pedinophyceae sp. YPF-701]|nr:unnamed protein product [Pedinophyceae sp. YPF-701]